MSTSKGFTSATAGDLIGPTDRCDCKNELEPGARGHMSDSFSHRDGHPMQTPANVPTRQTTLHTSASAVAHIERLLDEALALSFPASDPISVTAYPEDRPCGPSRKTRD